MSLICLLSKTMYRKNKYNKRYRNGKRRSHGGRNHNHKIKSFDPTVFINSNSNTNHVKEDIEIVNTFEDFKISDSLKQKIRNRGFKTPTPIQDKCIPAILEGRDVIGKANTGTGKTAAFLIPLIEKVISNDKLKILIVTPTRELAIQIEDDLYHFTKHLGIYSALCIGGVNKRRQINDIRRNPNFVIATPGRLIDLIRNKYLTPSSFSCVVLDETDRMVDIGFIKDIKYIVSLLPRNRQSLFFSATINAKVKEILHDFVNNPVIVSVKTGEAAQNIKQSTIKVQNGNGKVEKLHELLIRKEYEKVLIFGRTKRGVQRLSNELNDRGFRSGAIHGNKNQNQRSKVLKKFKRNEIRILTATDVASRGLDIPNVSHVINYDMPESKDAYIHRIGRTGRADKTGTALTFVS